MIKTAVRPYFYWFIGLLFVFLQFFLQLSIGVLMPTLEKALNLNPLEVGQLAASYYITYVALQLPAGALFDIYGTKILLSFGAVLCGFGCWFLSMSDTLVFAVFARILMGFGAAFAFVGAVQIIFENFPHRKHSFMVGVTESAAMVIALLANTYFAKLLVYYSWRHIFAGAGFVAILISLLCWLTLPASNVYSVGVIGRLFRSCLAMVKHFSLWANGLYCGLIFTLIASFSGLWAMPFLLSVQKAPLTEVTYEASMLFLGVAVGGPIAGLLYKAIRCPKLTLLASALISFVLVSYLIWWTPASPFFGAIVFFVLGFFSCGYIINYPLACDSVAAVERGAALGFTNMLCVCTVPIMQVLVGFLVKNAFAKHSGVELAGDYQSGLILLPIALLFAAFLVRFVPGKLVEDEV